MNTKTHPYNATLCYATLLCNNSARFVLPHEYNNFMNIYNDRVDLLLIQNRTTGRYALEFMVLKLY